MQIKKQTKTHFSKTFYKFTKKVWSNIYKDITPVWSVKNFKWREKCQGEDLYGAFYKGKDLILADMRHHLQFKRADNILYLICLSWVTGSFKYLRKDISITELYQKEVDYYRDHGIDIFLGSSTTEFTKKYWKDFADNSGYQTGDLFSFKRFNYQLNKGDDNIESRMTSLPFGIDKLKKYDIPDIKFLIESSFNSDLWILNFSNERWYNELSYPDVSETIVLKTHDSLIGFVNWYYYDYIFQNALQNGAAVRFVLLLKLSLNEKLEVIRFILRYLQTRGISFVSIDSYVTPDYYCFKQVGFTSTEETNRIPFGNLTKRYNITDISQFGIFDII